MFALSVAVPAVWLRWQGSVFQSPCVLSLLLYRAQLWMRGQRQTHPPVVIVYCFIPTEWNIPPEKGCTRMTAVVYLLMAAVLLLWAAGVNRCRADSIHTMPTGRPEFVHLEIQMQSVPRQN